MYKVGDSVLYKVGIFEYPSVVAVVEDSQLLIEVESDVIIGSKYSKLYDIKGENLVWVGIQEVIPYKRPTEPILVYCSHIYGGKPSNLADMTKKLRAINAKYSEVISDKEFVFVSPLNALPFYDLVEYTEGMRQCLGLLKNCSMLVLFGKDWDKSRGVAMEIEYAKANKISIVTEEEFMGMLEGK